MLEDIRDSFTAIQNSEIRVRDSVVHFAIVPNLLFEIVILGVENRP